MTKGEILSAFHQPWALMPERLKVLAYDFARLCRQGDAERLVRPSGEPAARISLSAGARSGTGPRGVAILPVRGVITHHFSWAGDTSTDRIQATLADLLARPDVGAIVLDIDSPGGEVAGIEELATWLRSRRGGGKRIVAVANSLAASAAYWIGSAADAFYATPSGLVGSIGVWTAHIDVSQAMEKIGWKVTLVSAGKYKTEGNPFEELGEEAAAEIQRKVDVFYDAFVRGVAKNRGVIPTEVREAYGQGRVIEAKRAAKLGMIDGVATLDQVITKMTPKRRPATRRAVRRALAGLALALADD